MRNEGGKGRREERKKGRREEGRKGGREVVEVVKGKVTRLYHLFLVEC